MSEVARAIDTPRGVLLVTVKRVTDPFGRIDHDDLRRAARVLLAEAAVLSEANGRIADRDVINGGVWK